MKTHLKAAVGILVLLAATAARGDNTVIIACPGGGIGVRAIVPAGWYEGVPGQMGFKSAQVNPHGLKPPVVECFYTDNKD